MASLLMSPSLMALLGYALSDGALHDYLPYVRTTCQTRLCCIIYIVLPYMFSPIAGLL